MGKAGRFGKYGEQKRIKRLRQTRQNLYLSREIKPSRKPPKHFGDPK